MHRPLFAWRRSPAISAFRPIGDFQTKFKRRWPTGRLWRRWARYCGVPGPLLIGNSKTPPGDDHSLGEFRGRPVLLLFFLGRGCLHCKEQLNRLRQKGRRLSDAGLTVIAISTDSQSGIKGSIADYQPQPFPFLMVSDPELKAFQSYRAYDTFEQIALHGTFLVDREGFCRWHDISFEPFMDLDFLLAESKRLLSRAVAPVEPGVRVIPD